MIIVGLGNPGLQYACTRHNLGFMVLDRFARRYPDLIWKAEFGVSWGWVGDHYFIKPQEFMNVSGATLKTFCHKKGLTCTADTLLVIHDDLDLPLGDLRKQTSRSAAGHQGVQSIIEAFGTQDFQRWRLGIGDNRPHNVPAEEYVLQEFTAEEWPIIDRAIDHAADLLQEKFHS